MDKQTIMLGDREVIMDPENLKFTDGTLHLFMEKEAAWYAYFGAMLANAEYLQHRKELEYEVLYSERFKENKDKGSSDKMAEAIAKADPDAEELKQEVLTAKYKVKLLQQHLRAWDRAHENAQSRGHFIRKEMDKLDRDLHTPKPDNYLERQIESIIKEADV